MSKYDRDRIARLFDNMIDSKSLGKDSAKSIRNIPQLTSWLAFERLELTSKDVLLDIGTGTGEKAIAAGWLCLQCYRTY